MNRTITYAVESDSGLVVSRVGSEIACPVLDYAGMVPANNFAMHYQLERMSIYALQPWRAYHWTRKVPTELKNRHREFWDMKPLSA